MSLQCLGSLLWCGFDPWPRNFHMPRAHLKKNVMETGIRSHGHIAIVGTGIKVTVNGVD